MNHTLEKSGAVIMSLGLLRYAVPYKCRPLRWQIMMTDCWHDQSLVPLLHSSFARSINLEEILKKCHCKSCFEFILFCFVLICILYELSFVFYMICHTLFVYHGNYVPHFWNFTSKNRFYVFHGGRYWFPVAPWLQVSRGFLCACDRTVRRP